jgi:hypothetical protein
MRRSKENLKKISELCESLPDRDIRLKEEYFLLKKIFEDLPLKVFAIKINKEMKIISHLGVNASLFFGKDLLDIFEKDSDYITSCFQSMVGKNTTTQIILNGKTFECINNPVKSEDGKINSIVSVAWSKE